MLHAGSAMRCTHRTAAYAHTDLTASDEAHPPLLLILSASPCPSPHVVLAASSSTDFCTALLSKLHDKQVTHTQLTPPHRGLSVDAPHTSLLTLLHLSLRVAPRSVASPSAGGVE